MNIVKAAAEVSRTWRAPSRSPSRSISVAEMFGGKEELMAETNKTLRLTQVRKAPSA